MSVHRLEWIVLVGILAIAVFLRCIQLNAGLWYDEVMTLVTYVRLPTGELLTNYSSLNNHILYSLSAQLSIGLFGESAWALRLPAMLFGVGSVAAVWWLGREVTGRKESLLAALLLACSSHHIWFSQNARGYTGLLLAALVATALFLRGLRTSTNRIWVAYAVVLALAIYLHLSAAFVFVTHALIYCAILAKRWRQSDEAHATTWAPLGGMCLGGVLTLLCYGPLIPQMVTAFTDVSEEKTYGGVAEWKNPIWALAEAVTSLGQGSPVLLIALTVGAVLAVVGLLSFLKREPAFAWIPLLHVPLTLAILIVGSFRIWPRFFFVDAGFGILCLVHGTFITSRYVSSRNWTPKFGFSGPSRSFGDGVAVSVTVIGVVGSLFLLPRTYQLPKQDFQGARNFVESERSHDDVVASVGLASRVFEQYYAPHWEVVENVERIQQLRKDGGRMWILYSFPKHTTAKYPALVEAVESQFELVRIFWGTLNGGQVLVFRSRDS